MRSSRLGAISAGAMALAGIVGAAQADGPHPAPPARSYPYAYVHISEPRQPEVILARSDEHDPYRYTRERVWPGYGGPRLEHQFGMSPDDPERPRNRHYYPYVWGGYGFSAPYYVSRRDYYKPEYEAIPYGRAQKRRFYRDHWKDERWNEGRW